jgi:erythromycin esterase
MKRVPWPVLLVALAACGGGGSSPTAPAPATPDPGELAAWVRQRSLPFDTDDPAAPSADLLPVKAMVGSARVVALGEGTHGSAEFFRMKHRLLRLLVEEMGFTAFGIEASFPDTEPINDYVLFGQGDARQALAGQGFWTWRAEEVLAMVQWMREYNRLHGPALSFRGFDMQNPPSSMEAVVRYLEGIDPAAAARAAGLYRPFQAYFGEDGGAGYRTAPGDVKAQVRGNLAEVVSLLAAEESRYVAASSRTAFADALHNARLVQQGESFHSVTVNEGSAVRDAAMAENALWLLDEAGPQARIVLWAHNYHVQKDVGWANTMGVALDRRLGAQMRVLGFAFGQGACTAIDITATPLVPRPLNVPRPFTGSYEEMFSRTGRPRFLLDMRGLSPGTPGPDWLMAGHPHRVVGAYYDPARPDGYFTSVRLDRLFDVLVYFENTTASRVY